MPIAYPVFTDPYLSALPPLGVFGENCLICLAIKYQLKGNRVPKSHSDAIKQLVI